MATSKKRITVSLSDKSFETFARFADLQDKPNATVVAALLEELAPSLEGTVRLLEKAKSAPDGVKERLIGVFDRLESDILSSLERADQTDLFGEKH